MTVCAFENFDVKRKWHDISFSNHGRFSLEHTVGDFAKISEK